MKGLYRVNYNIENWQRIATYLRSNNRERIHRHNRAQVNIVTNFIKLLRWVLTHLSSIQADFGFGDQISLII